jgi:hypothetical protein
MKCASAKATHKTGTSATDTGTSAADTGTSATHTGTSATHTGTSATHTGTSATSAATAAAAAATAAATGRQFYLLGERGWFAVFPVKCVKRRQAGVEDFLLAEKEFMRL